MTPPPRQRPTGCLVLLVTTATAINLVVMGLMVFGAVVGSSSLRHAPWFPAATVGFFALGAVGPGLMLMTRLRRNAAAMGGLYGWLVATLVVFLILGSFAAVGM